MANNVDLMVTGAVDGVTAAELTERLMKAFGQPAEAFAELVAAACDNGPAYAAQTGVALETAVEGQAKLEEHGVVCQVLVDGKMVSETLQSGSEDCAPAASPGNGEDKLAAPATESAGNTDAVADNQESNDPADEAASAGVKPIADIDSESSEEDSVSVLEDVPTIGEVEATATDDKTDASDVLPVTDGLELFDVSFEDELGGIKLPETTDSAASQEQLPSEDGLQIVDVDFDQELDSFDDDVVKTKREVAAVAGKTTDSESLPVEEPPQHQPEEIKAEEIKAAEVEEEIDQAPQHDEVSMGIKQEESVDSGSDKPQDAHEIKDQPLELSLSDDDSTPLTQPKKKSDSVPDDGGLTLALEDTPAPKPAPVKPDPAQPSDNDADLALELESTIDSRDTTREPIENAPVEVPEEQSTPEDQGDDAGNRKEKPKPAEATADSDTESNELIDTLSTDEKPAQSDTPAPAGLVLPGQSQTPKAETSATPEPVEPVEPEAAPEPVSTEADDEAKAVEEISEVVSVSSANVDEVYAPESAASGGLTEEFIAKRKMKRVAMAAGVVCAVGAGAFAVQYSGILKPTAATPVTVAVVEPVDDKAELEAVEEGSLNAALERTSSIKNPDKYSTEELIMYLAGDLGEGAKAELKSYVSGDYKPNESDMPRMGAAIPADSDSELWLRNRVAHDADKYFDEWSKREVDLQAYLELQQRLADAGDLDIALDVSKGTKDKFFSVMSQQALARAFHATGDTEKATEVLAIAVRGTYAIDDPSERVLAIADHAVTENVLGLVEDADDTFLKSFILSRSLHKSESRTVAFAAIAEFCAKAKRVDDALEFLELAVTTAYELPANTAARDLAIRHVALTEVRLGLTEQATEHAGLIVDPFAAVSALHGIALVLERNGEEEKARLMLNKAYRAGSLIKNSEKREKLLDQVRLAGN